MFDLILETLQNPMIALFLTISLGYLVGKIKYKTFVLGGISGSLLVGVIIGQLGIKIPDSIGGIFFALFIYAVGYQGGAQFFRSLNRQTLVQLVSATLTCVLGLLCVLIFAWIFHLDKGTAAGLGAGGLTQSAMIGSASDALSQLNLPHSAIQIMQANVAVGYAVCYIFGSFGPIILLASIFPLIMRWNLRKEAVKLASEKTQDGFSLEPGQFNAFSNFITRAYLINTHSNIIGKKLTDIYTEFSRSLLVESILRKGKLINDLSSDFCLQNDDVVSVTAHREDFKLLAKMIGVEVEKPKEMQVIEEKKSCVLTNKKLHNQTISNIKKIFQAEGYYGVLLQEVFRFGEKLPITEDLKLKKGDDLILVGKSKDLDTIINKIGRPISSAPLTDFVFFGLGMVLGFLLGLITFDIFGVSIVLGSGVGCLLSGLIFGWIRAVKPQYGALPVGASNFLRDFGLAVFVASVGITAGPQAVQAIKSYGLLLFVLGIGVTIIPQVLSFYISYYILRIKNPIVLLATIAGGRSANPGFAALLEKTGNSTPVIPFTSTYAIANIWLTLWGPIIVALVATNVH